MNRAGGSRTAPRDNGAVGEPRPGSGRSSVTYFEPIEDVERSF